MDDKPRVYKPSLQIFINLILFTDFFFFILYAINFFVAEQAIIFSVLINIVEAVLWFFVIHPVFKVTLDPQTITGPSPALKSTTMEREMVNRTRLHNQTPEAKRWGYRDIISRERVCIRVWIRILGDSQVHRLMHRIKKA